MVGHDPGLVAPVDLRTLLAGTGLEGREHQPLPHLLRIGGEVDAQFVAHRLDVEFGDRSDCSPQPVPPEIRTPGKIRRGI